jgi:hypothetical protein
VSGPIAALDDGAEPIPFAVAPATRRELDTSLAKRGAYSDPARMKSVTHLLAVAIVIGSFVLGVACGGAPSTPSSPSAPSVASAAPDDSSAAGPATRGGGRAGHP